jgi:hypothetical protein
MQYTWNGGDGSYTDATQWTPQDVPLYGGGASALIQSGTVILSNTRPDNVLINLSGPSEATQPDLVLDNAAFGSGVLIILVAPANPLTNPIPPVGFATITVNGYDTSEAEILLGAGQLNPDFLTVAIAPYGQLNQEGRIGVFSNSQMQVKGTGQEPATLNNDGVINIGGGYINISADVIGSGAIAFISQPTYGSLVVLDGGVSATQHIKFGSSTFPTPETLRLDNPSTFHGILDGFADMRDSVTLANTQATSAYFAQVTPDSGALLLLNGQAVVGVLTITGAHASNAYSVSGNTDGGTTVHLASVLPSS